MENKGTKAKNDDRQETDKQTGKDKTRPTTEKGGPLTGKTRQDKT
jgi:hypothetical protein